MPDPNNSSLRDPGPDTAGQLLNMADVVLGPPLARGQGGDPAILCDGESVSYALLDERVNRAGNALRTLGIGAEDRVLLLLADRPIFFYAYLGLLRIGAVPCALNPRLPLADLAHIVADSGTALMLGDEQSVSSCAEASAGTPARLLTAAALSTAMETASAELVSVMRPADAPGFWMYSSGTTGKPKGVVHAQRTVLGAADLLGTVMDVGPGDRVLCTSKLFFAFALGHMVFATLHLGATAILHPHWPSAVGIAVEVERYRPTVMLSVPTLYRNMLRDGVARASVFANVRHFLSAGEKLPLSLFERWRAATGRPILDGIGATETCFDTLSNRPDRLKPGTCGMPTPGTEVKLIADDGSLIVEAGRPGVLWVRLVSVALGYWNRDEATAATFQDGWYRTSDMFTRDAEGFYEYQGRADDMLKISGQWVSPAEIEEQVLKHPNVVEAAVVGVPNEDGLLRLALFLVAPAVPDRTLFEAELQDHLLAVLPSYKCPRRFFFVDEMPVTATGKLQRYALRQKAAG